MDEIDKKLLNFLQWDFPLTGRPFKDLGTKLGIGEEETIERVSRMKESRVIRQISAIFDSRKLGYKSTLVAMKFLPEKLDAAAEVINQHPGVSHNYARDHVFNLWFTLTIPSDQNVSKTAKELGEKAGSLKTLFLPTIRLFKIGVKFDIADEVDPMATSASKSDGKLPHSIQLSDLDIEVVRALQEDLPLVKEPFGPLADKAGMSKEELLGHGKRMLDSGVMRRFAAVLRHQLVGFTANAMGVWIVSPDKVEEVGPIMGSFNAVSHCYQRPTYPPDWPYNLFTMVHARSPDVALEILKRISSKTGINDYAALFSTHEYKKERVKYFV